MSGRTADAAGALLATSLAVLSVLSARTHGEVPSSLLLILGAAVVSYGVGRLVAPAVHGVAVLLVGTVAIVALLSPNALSGSPTSQPLGYANANAALYVQLAALTGLVAVVSRSEAWRAAGVVATVVLIVLNAVVGSAGGILTGVAVTLAVLVALRNPPPHAVLAITALLVAAVVIAPVVTYALGAAFQPGQPTAAILFFGLLLSGRRLMLWKDAVALIEGSPLHGIGPGAFSTTSPTAIMNPDTSEAHAALLEIAAELGLPAAGLALLLMVWFVLRPFAGGRPTAVALVPAAAAAGLVLYASVDYVASFPVVVALAALVVGCGTSLSGAATVTDSAGSTRSEPRLS